MIGNRLTHAHLTEETLDLLGRGVEFQLRGSQRRVLEGRLDSGIGGVRVRNGGQFQVFGRLERLAGLDDALIVLGFIVGVDILRSGQGDRVVDALLCDGHGNLCVLDELVGAVRLVEQCLETECRCDALVLLLRDDDRVGCRFEPVHEVDGDTGRRQCRLELRRGLQAGGVAGSGRGHRGAEEQSSGQKGCRRPSSDPLLRNNHFRVS
ncbi:hypothetical protein FQ377_11165 [Arthrobacter echini]|uniref:Uncharacterized protein n=1 Tax=Arthrobacter echini TaxID=1529066 RepID=A0A5D0XPU3_9MICC|nr:hypothetical protein FQ377_11165 [Arthrobacter echini]